jgi:hypothetical protein
MLSSYRLGCASAWLADVFLWLFMAQGECTSVFSVVLLFKVGVGVVMLLASFAGVRNVRRLCFTSNGLPSYRLGCASAWLADVFVVVYGPGRVHQCLQRGTVGLNYSGAYYARQMADDHAAVDMAAIS